MDAKDIMSKNPDFLPPNASLKKAAELMKSHDYGFIPVGENDRLIGTVTDRDITIKAVAQGLDPSKNTLSDVMSKGIHYCFEKDDVQKVAKQMEDLQIRRIVVLNDDKRMTGVISLGDLAVKCHDANLTGEVTEAVSEH